MSDEILVDHEATLDAARREAEMWRTAKDRLAEQLTRMEVAADAKVALLRAECATLRETIDAIEAMLVKKKRMSTLFDVQQIRKRAEVHQ